MADSIRSFVNEHRAFYEVLPYYVVFEERRIQAGFDVDIYGVRTEDNKLEMPPPDKYALAYSECQNLAAKVSKHTTDSCSLEVIPSPSTALVDVRDHKKVEGTISIRISHCRGLDQPASPAEQRALEEVEKELKNLGIKRR